MWNRWPMISVLLVSVIFFRQLLYVMFYMFFTRYPPQTWALSSRTSPPCCCRTPTTLQGRLASALSGPGWRSTPRSASGSPSLLLSTSYLSSTSPTAKVSWRAPWMWWWKCLTNRYLTQEIYLITLNNQDPLRGHIWSQHFGELVILVEIGYCQKREGSKSNDWLKEAHFRWNVNVYHQRVVGLIDWL